VSLDDRMKRALLALELTAQGKAYSYAPVTAHAAPESMEPLGDADPPHLLYRRRYAGCRTDAQRSQVIKAAEAELDSILYVTKPTRPMETPSQREGRILRDGEGWELVIAANGFRMLPRTLRDLRVRHGRDPDYGRLPETPGTIVERRERVREMRAQGRSVRSIAATLRVSHETIRSDLTKSDRRAA